MDELNAEQEQIAREVMQPDYTFERGGGGSKGRRVKQDKPLTIADRIEKQRRRLADAEEIPFGRPLKGKEVRVRINARVEPSTIKKIQEATGLSPVEFLESAAAILDRTEGVA